MVLPPEDNVNESVLSAASILGSTARDNVFPTRVSLLHGCVPEEIFHDSLEVIVNTLVPPSASKLAVVDDMVNTLSIVGLGCPFTIAGVKIDKRAANNWKYLREFIRRLNILQVCHF